MGCGREPGGRHAADKGVCPAATAARFHGVNRGVQGGRFCWAVAGTFCGGEVQGTFARKLRTCLDCRFFRLVEREEGRHFVLTERQIPGGEPGTPA